MTAIRRLILENKMGQKIRSVRVQNEETHLIYRMDTRRVELNANLQSLDEQKIGYQVLKTITIAQLQKNDFVLENFGKLRLATEGESLQDQVYDLPQEQDDKKLIQVLKKSTVSHVVVVALLMILSLVLSSMKKETIEESQLVTIVVPPKDEPTQHVKVSEKKIKTEIPRQVKVTNRTIKKPVIRTTPKKMIAQKTVPVQRAPVIRERSDSSLQRVGALAALGGIKTGSLNSEGLDMQSIKNIRSAGKGLGGGGVGDAGAGGVQGMMNGSGLIAGSSGRGGHAQSAGGYGTKGVGGGKAGYGKMNIVGGTSGFNFPTEDAEVQGGLDMDQIAAVINRNKGQIIYCYERGLQAEPDLRGRVAMQFVIGGSGRITTLKVAQSSLRSSTVESCMASKMKSWQFPQPVGKVNVDVFYPFDLRRVSSI